MKYTVYSFQTEEVIKKLDRIAKKAEKYGVRFGYTVGEEHPVRVATHKVDHINNVAYTDKVFTVSGMDIDIDCDGFIRSNGWTVLAKIEHGDKGNIVTAIGNAEIRPEWYTAPARCDHCGTNRVRTFTFMVEKDGEIRQVGRSCLKDYTGIDPATALMWAQVTDIFVDDDMMDFESYEFRSSVVYDVDEILAYACDEIRKNGYRKADYINATKDAVMEAIHGSEKASAEGTTKAQKIIEWLCSIDDSVVGLERDCKALAQSGWAKIRHFGRLCYMPVAYDKEMERREIEAKRNAENAQEATQSGWLGNIGERITVKVARMNILTTWESQFGTTYLYKIVDVDGNVLMWRASHTMETTHEFVMKCTVKEHSEYRGVRQTVVTRCTAV